MNNPVIKSLLPFEKQLHYISLNKGNYKQITESLHLNSSLDEFKEVGWHSQVLNPRETGDQTVRWLFTVSSLNFCFWLDNNEAYTVEVNGKTYSGYWALCAGILRGQQMGVDLTNQSYVASDAFTLESLRQCFPNTKSGREVPLLQRRFEILKEDAKVLTSRYGGDIINLITQCNNSALTLVQLVASEFPSFDDRARVNSKQTAFDVKADSARA